MCGIAGFVNFGRDRALNEELLRRMTRSLRHRGPDDSGTSLARSETAVVGLGHARLSILDLSEAGHQPMKFGDLSIVFNGEIYNFLELRSELEDCGHKFQTGTDTEVILHAYFEWGIECIQRFIGMFAFCLHDARTEHLYLVRDRAGVKPLFVYQQDDFWIFASELKAFHECPLFHREVDLAQVGAFFDFGYVPDGGCIYQDCEKVDAGEFWEIDLRNRRSQRKQYWSAYDCYQVPKLDIAYSEAVAELETLMRSACNYRLIADVPVGVFLSGGYDSTAVAAILQADRTSRISTFTIGFTEGVDEAPHARETARRLGTDHHELYCSEAEAQEVIEELPTVFDEPFADSSAIPTILVSKMARQHVKVALSADAGDEQFCGYDEYQVLHARMKRISRIPRAVRPLISGVGKTILRTIPRKAVRMEHRLSGFSRALSRSNSTTGQMLHVFSRKLPAYYRNNIVAGMPQTTDYPFGQVIEDTCNGVEGAMALDYSTYLKDDLLVKVDRATMSVGLEGREPLVDHRILEFVAALPFEFKFNGGASKRILRDIVHRHVPSATMNRPKTGFSLEIYSWLRGDLGHLLDEFCAPRHLKESGFLNDKLLSTQVEIFRKGRLHYSPLIWRLLMFQMWHRRWVQDVTSVSHGIGAA